MCLPAGEVLQEPQGAVRELWVLQEPWGDVREPWVLQDDPATAPVPTGSPFLRVPQALCQRERLQAPGTPAWELQRADPGHLPGWKWLLDRTHLFLRG